MRRKHSRITSYLRKRQIAADLMTERRRQPKNDSSIIWTKPARKAENKAWDRLTYEEQILVVIKLRFL